MFARYFFREFENWENYQLSSNWFFFFYFDEILQRTRQIFTISLVKSEITLNDMLLRGRKCNFGIGPWARFTLNVINFETRKNIGRVH